MVRKFPLQKFFKKSQEEWAELPDERKPSPNTKYEGVQSKSVKAKSS